jgi:hypothetical protein
LQTIPYEFSKIPAYETCSVIKCTLIWETLVACMGEKRNAYKILVVKPEGK